MVRKVSSILVLITLSITLSSCSSSNKVEESIKKGCSYVLTSNWDIDPKATPYFAEAARHDPSYLVLIDKLQESQEKDMGYRTWKSTQAFSWLFKFCQGSQEVEIK
jgi:hypothetical protein